ncbi:MAG: M56 family metallopeptidase [Ginsengibacter sp.]
MNQFNFLFSPAAEALGNALLYSIGQSFIVFISLWILLKLIPNASARFKYCLLYVGYLSVSSWFIVTLIRQYSIAQLAISYQPIAGSQSFINTPAEQTSSIFSIFSLSFLNHYLPWLVGFYLLGIIYYSLRLSLNFFQTNQLKRKGIFELDKEWQEHIIRLAERLNIGRPLKTFFSRNVNTPMMIGFFRPVILLPLALMNHLTPQQFEAILLHELAHIRRNDYLLNLLQSIFDTILFFNPFTWWITSKIREERENCCDEMVLQLSDPYQYARALLALEEPIQNSQLLMTAVGNRSHLFHRIKKIIEMKNNPLNTRQKFMTLLILMITTVSVAWLSPSKNKRTDIDNEKMISKNSHPVGSSSFSTFLNFKFTVDSVPAESVPLPPMPPQPPVAMQENGILPTAPLPPSPPNSPMVPEVPLPPMPPSHEINDSFPPSADYFNSKEWKQQREAIKKSTNDMRKYFQSDAWKKQQDLLRENAVAMKKYFSGPQWKKQQELMKESAEDIKQSFNSAEWKKQVELMKKNGGGMKKYFDNPEWKKQQELIKKSAEDIKQQFNSAEWKKQVELMKKNGEEMKKYFNNPDWKKQQELIEQNSDSLKKYFNSPEWKKEQEQIRNSTDSLTSFFKGNAWQKQQENILNVVIQSQKKFKAMHGNNNWKI